jgi:hypothetical protein
MKSNFLKYTPVAAKVEGVTASQNVTEIVPASTEDKENNNLQNIETTRHNDSKTHPELPRHNRMLSYLSLSSSQIFKIY